VGGWNAIYGPRGLPNDIRHLLGNAIALAVKEPEFAARLRTLGVEPVGMGADEATAYFNAEFQRWESHRRSRAQARKVTAQEPLMTSKHARSSVRLSPAMSGSSSSSRRAAADRQCRGSHIRFAIFMTHGEILMKIVVRWHALPPTARSSPTAE